MTDAYKFPDEDENTGTFGTDDDAAAGKKAAAENEIEVVVIDDTPPQDQGRKPLEESVDDPTDDEVAQYSAKVQDRIKKLTHARHDERREKERLLRENEELTRVAQTTLQERDRLREQVGEGAKLMSTQALTMVTKEIADAKAALQQAHAEFDSEGIVNAQEALFAAQLKKDRIENNRANTTQSEESVVSSQQSAPSAKPKLDEKTQKWMSNNRWFGEGGDAAMTGYALGLHQDMVKKYGDSFTRTDEYYSQIDAAMRQTFPTKFSSGNTKKPGSIVAPATRVAAGPKKVQLTTSQVALAKKFGMTTQQYAAELVKLQGESE